MTGKELRESGAEIYHDLLVFDKVLYDLGLCEHGVVGLLAKARLAVADVIDLIPLDFDSEKEKRGSGGEGTDP